MATGGSLAGQTLTCGEKVWPVRLYCMVGCLLTRWNILSSQLHRSRTLCRATCWSLWSWTSFVHSQALILPIQFLARFTATTSTTRGTEHAYFSVKGGISNNFRRDSVNEDVIFAIGMSLVIVARFRV